MNFIKNQEYMTEMRYGSDFSYILSQQIQISATEYKVLKNQKDSLFLRCVKMKYNGKEQLYYLAREYKTLEMVLDKIDVSTFLTIVGKLFFNVIELKNNGFLLCQNIITSIDRIFIDMGTLNVFMVYLPISIHLHDSVAEFDNELRTQMIQVISGYISLESDTTLQLARCLTDSSMTLNSIYEQFWGSAYTSTGMGFNQVMGRGARESITVSQRVHTMDQKNHQTKKTGNISSSYSGINSDELKLLFPDRHKHSMRLISTNMPITEEIKVNKDSFVLGKGGEGVDAVITFNPTISRRHCQIIFKNDAYYLRDLKSSNGTLVNGHRLVPEQYVKISNGDMVYLANTAFRVIIE